MKIENFEEIFGQLDKTEDLKEYLIEKLEEQEDTKKENIDFFILINDIIEEWKETIKIVKKNEAEVKIYNEGMGTGEMIDKYKL